MFSIMKSTVNDQPLVIILGVRYSNSQRANDRNAVQCASEKAPQSVLTLRLLLMSLTSA